MLGCIKVQEFENSITQHSDLEKERIDLMNACASGDYCGKDLEHYYNNCCINEEVDGEIKKRRCWIAEILDINDQRRKGYIK